MDVWRAAVGGANVAQLCAHQLVSGFVLLRMLCCLWQIFHEAPPYSDMSPHEAAVLVVNGGSLVPHASTPAPVAELMNQCFVGDIS